MTRQIYLLQNDDTLEALEETPYDNEALLQRLLEQHPALLGGDRGEGAPPRYLLIAREMGVPDADEGGTAMYLDHLFIDQEGVPTLVEVKRSSDTRIRREVVGQMLDYAANGVAYWPLATIRAAFDAQCARDGVPAEQRLAEHVGGDPNDGSEEEFWQQVKTNLQAGRIRLVFVADALPPQLQRIIEFLNEQMDPAEVLGIELRQYVGEGLRTIVPRVVGQTAEAQQRKGTAPKRKWTEAEYFAELARNCSAEEVAALRRLLAWSREHVTRIWWGEGSRSGSFVPIAEHGGQKFQLFAAYTQGRILIYFQYFASRKPFDDVNKREALRLQLNEIPGIDIPADGVNRQPGIQASALVDDAAFQRFTTIFARAVADFVAAQE